MKNRKNNKGFTLVELMVAITISVIVVGAIWQFMLISTRTYENQKTITDLQQEVQQTMNHIENIVIDADRAVEVVTDEPNETETMEVYSATKVSKLIWNKTEKTLTYTETPVNKGKPVNDKTESALLANGVEDFKVDMSKVESNKIIKVAMEFSRKGKTYNAARNIALRNTIIVNNDTDEVYKNDVETTQPITITINSPVGPDGIEPGSSAVFQAVVNGTDDQTVIWTLLQAKSKNTFIDISSGKLYVGLDENTESVTKEGQITVVATLASNRNIIATESVSVAPPPEVSLTVKHFPSAVVYGKTYDIEAEATPAEGTTIQWTVLSGNARIKGTGAKAKLDLTEKPTTLSDIIQVKVEVYKGDKLVNEQILETKVRQPEFTIKALETSDGKSYKEDPAKFVYGNQVKLEADWSNSYSNRAGFIEYDESYGVDQYVKYPKGYFDDEKVKEVIFWTVSYVDKDGDTQYLLENSTTQMFTIPKDMSVTRINVKGVSNTYPFVTYQRVLDLATPTLTLEAYVGTSKEPLTGMIPLKETIIVKPILSGLNKGSYSTWSIKGPNGENIENSDTTNATATFAIKTDDLESYMGKTIEVTVTETTSKLTATIKLPVIDILECEEVWDSEEGGENHLKYLFADKYKKKSSSLMYTYPPQNTFFVELPEGTDTSKCKVNYTFYSKNDVAFNDYGEVMKFSLKKDGILCEPVRPSRRSDFKYDNFGYIIIHVDSLTTGEHIAMYKVEPTLANYRYEDEETGDVAWFYIDQTSTYLEQLYNANKQEPTLVCEYENFYGRMVSLSEFNGDTNYPQKKTYTCFYDYNQEVTYDRWGKATYKDTYTVELNFNNTQIYSKKYTKSTNNNTWS